jgi:hypothetical protein
VRIVDHDVDRARSFRELVEEGAVRSPPSRSNSRRAAWRASVRVPNGGESREPAASSYRGDAPDRARRPWP